MQDTAGPAEIGRWGRCMPPRGMGGIKTAQQRWGHAQKVQQGRAYSRRAGGTKGSEQTEKNWAGGWAMPASSVYPPASTSERWRGRCTADASSGDG